MLTEEDLKIKRQQKEQIEVTKRIDPVVEDIFSKVFIEKKHQSYDRRQK